MPRAEPLAVAAALGERVSSLSILGEPMISYEDSGITKFALGEITYPPDCVPLGDITFYLGEFDVIYYVGERGDILISLLSIITLLLTAFWSSTMADPLL